MGKKATHRGTCQACGRMQKLPGGWLSLHGYTVDWGYFNGTCDGSKHLPLEKSREYLDATVKNLREEADRLDKEEPRTLVCEPAERFEYRGRGYGARRVRVAGEVENDFEKFRTLALENMKRWGFSGGWPTPHDSEWYLENYGDLETQKERTVKENFEKARERGRANLRNRAKQYRGHAKMLLSLADEVHGKKELVEIGGRG